MAAVTNGSDFGPKRVKCVPISTFSPSICHEVMGLDAVIFVFRMLSFKPAFSLSYFTFIKRKELECNFLRKGRRRMGKYAGLTKNMKTNQKSKLPVTTSWNWGNEKPISEGRSILSTTAFRNARAQEWLWLGFPGLFSNSLQRLHPSWGSPLQPPWWAQHSTHCPVMVHLSRHCPSSACWLRDEPWRCGFWPQGAHASWKGDSGSSAMIEDRGSIMVHSKTWKRGCLSWTYYSK